jgi:trehalose utilization protein
MRLQGRYVGVLLTIPLYFAVMVLIHEFGHVAGVTYATGAEARIYVWPGYEIYPQPGRRDVALASSC